MVNKKIFKLPILTLVGGIVFRIINQIIISLMMSGTNEWTLEMGTTIFYIDVVLSLIIFIVIGIILRKTYDRETFLKSATLLVIYSIIILVVEQGTQYFGPYNIGNSLYLYLPVEIFVIITSALARVSTSESINWMYAIPSLFAPYLFMLFAKNSKMISWKNV